MDVVGLKKLWQIKDCFGYTKFTQLGYMHKNVQVYTWTVVWHFVKLSFFVCVCILSQGLKCYLFWTYVFFDNCNDHQCKNIALPYELIEYIFSNVNLSFTGRIMNKRKIISIGNTCTINTYVSYCFNDWLLLYLISTFH